MNASCSLSYARTPDRVQGIMFSRDKAVNPHSHYKPQQIKVALGFFRYQRSTALGTSIFGRPAKHYLTAERRKEMVVSGIGWHRIFLRSWFAELFGVESGAGRVQRVARMRYPSIPQ